MSPSEHTVIYHKGPTSQRTGNKAAFCSNLPRVPRGIFMFLQFISSGSGVYGPFLLKGIIAGPIWVRTTCKSFICSLLFFMWSELCGQCWACPPWSCSLRNKNRQPGFHTQHADGSGIWPCEPKGPLYIKAGLSASSTRCYLHIWIRRHFYQVWLQLGLKSTLRYHKVFFPLVFLVSF